MEAKRERKIQRKMRYVHFHVYKGRLKFFKYKRKKETFHNKIRKPKKTFKFFSVGVSCLHMKKIS